MKIKVAWLCFLWSVLFGQVIVFAQTTVGQPDILNFYHEQINSGSQTWAIAQDRYGTMYFANNSGLLTYNGKEWKLFYLPNKTIVRAVAISNNAKIFVGGQDALGYFLPDERGRLQYYSLLEKLPLQFRRFGDVWNISQDKNLVYFRTGTNIFAYDIQKDSFNINTAPNSSSWSFMEVCNGQLYAQNSHDGLINLTGGKKQIIEPDIFRNTIVSAILSFGKDSLMIITAQKGVFIYANAVITKMPLDEQITNSQILTGIALGNNQFAVGSVSNGVYIINKKGKTIRNFSGDNGLQNNNVLSLYLDKNKGLWAALDEGISLIDYASPIQKISVFSKTPIPSYTSAIYHNSLYIGTSDGVYSTTLTTPPNDDITLSKATFSKIPNSHRQVWSLYNYKDKLLMGHHNGAYLIENKVSLIDDANEGCWLFRAISGSKNLIMGTYGGVRLLSDERKGFKINKLLENNANEPFRFIEIDSAHHTVWASHPYRGIYKISMNKNYAAILKTELLTRKNGLPNDLNNFVFKANGHLVFTTENGVYVYDYSKGRFVVAKNFRPIFGNMMIKFLTTDSKKRIWFATEKEVGVVENGKIVYINELEGKLIAGFENIYPYNDKNIFFSAHKGLIHLNYERYRYSHFNINTILNKVVAIGKTDSLLFDGFLAYPQKTKATAVFKLPAAFNSYHFEYSSDKYNQNRHVSYSYQLKGYDEGWSSWSTNTTKDYTNLPFGKYVFHVKAKDTFGNISNISSYSFEILPRWYQTKFASLIYFLAIVFSIYVALWFHRKRLQKQKQAFASKQKYLKYVHELEIEKNEAEIVRLKNEHLETEMMYKNKELASTTMHLFNRGRLLGKIKDELNNVLSKTTQKEESSDLNRLLRLINQEEKQENNWEQFSLHFDEVHNRFLQKLKMAYPDLTPGDLKLCAYLKMNLSSKEIAQLLYLSLKGVENGRYRLRKKFNLEANDSLTDFILTFN